MAVTTHDVVKPEAIASAAVQAIADQLTISHTFTRFDAAEYLGKAGDTLTMRVPGTLPFRRWDFRNDRREALRVDKYSETTVNMTVGASWLYSAVELTPEQKQFDFGGSWGDIFNLQTQAIAQGFEFDAYAQLRNAPYERVKVIKTDAATLSAAKDLGQDAIFNQFVDLKTDLNRMRVPDQRFVCIAGSAVIAALTKTNKLVRVGEGAGDSAFATNNVGTYAGITFLQGPYVMEPNEAFLYAPSGFLQWNAAPPTPDGPGKYANANANGISLQWVQDYDPAFVASRSIFMTWKSETYTKDYISLEDGQGRTYTSPDQYFLRGVKILFDADPLLEKTPGDGKTDTPGGLATSYLAKAYNGELAEVVALDGPLIPFELRAGTVTENVPDTTP